MTCQSRSLGKPKFFPRRKIGEETRDDHGPLPKRWMDVAMVGYYSLNLFDLLHLTHRQTSPSSHPSDLLCPPLGFSVRLHASCPSTSVPPAQSGSERHFIAYCSFHNGKHSAASARIPRKFEAKALPHHCDLAVRSSAISTQY